MTSLLSRTRWLDHELKNPLTAIRVGLANVEQARAGTADPALASVASQADRISPATSKPSAVGMSGSLTKNFLEITIALGSDPGNLPAC